MRRVVVVMLGLSKGFSSGKIITVLNKVVDFVEC